MSRQLDFDGRVLTIFCGPDQKQQVEIHDGRGRFVQLPLDVFLCLVERAYVSDSIFQKELLKVLHTGQWLGIGASK